MPISTGWLRPPHCTARAYLWKAFVLPFHVIRARHFPRPVRSSLAMDVDHRRHVAATAANDSAAAAAGETTVYSGTGRVRSVQVLLQQLHFVRQVIQRPFP